jgi:hypothetical protein
MCHGLPPAIVSIGFQGLHRTNAHFSSMTMFVSDAQLGVKILVEERPVLASKAPPKRVRGGGHVHGKISALLLCATIAISLVGCSGAPSGRAAYRLAGVWVGKLRASCAGNCFREPEISFTLFQQPSGIYGFYRCWSGSSTCPEPDEGGKVRVLESEPTALWMRVVTRDGSRCLFEGLPEGDKIEGGRICFTSRGAIRHGWWRIQRAY